MHTFYRTKVLGTGSYLPEKLLTNKDIEKLVETNDEWIRERTGISARHIAAENQTTSDLALMAAQKALQAANVSSTEIEMIIFATVTPDHLAPNTACMLQQKLGCGPIPAVDLNAACTGFIYALTFAHQFIRTGTYKKILIIGAEILSRIVNYEDRETCILFGDGAGAMVVGRSETGDDADILATHLGAEGNLGHLFELFYGGVKYPISEEFLKSKNHLAKMRGKEIFKNAVRTMAGSCDKVLTESKITKDQVSWVIPHQANVRIIEGVAKYLDVSMSKVVVNIENMGNTSAATVPVAFDETVRAGKIKRGQHILLTGFGAGLTSGSLLLKY